LNKNITSNLLCEFLGSMLLVSATTSSVVMFTNVLEANKALMLFANAVATAFVLIALIEIFGKISGAHFNPIVSVIVWLEKGITATKALWYILTQIIGGFCGIVLTHLMFWGELVEIQSGVLAISENARGGVSVYIGEIVGSFVLVLAILLLGYTKSKRASVTIGFLVGGKIMATSSTMFANPQVTIARMFTGFSSGIRPSDAAIFVLMQFVGAFLAYLVYRVITPQEVYYKPKSKKEI